MGSLFGSLIFDAGAQCVWWKTPGPPTRGKRWTLGWQAGKEGDVNCFDHCSVVFLSSIFFFFLFCEMMLSEK